MQLTFQCPGCLQPNRTAIEGPGSELQCEHCQWSRPVLDADLTGDKPERCLACGCDDVWRQKDFPQKLGVALVGTGALLSTIAWYYMMPVTAIGILMAFALVDYLLYLFMNDVLVCYRCGARHHRANLEDHPTFDLEIAERYRQESLRLEQSAKSQTPSGTQAGDPAASGR